MVQRVAIRTRKSYNTASNRRRVVKTPCELLGVNLMEEEIEPSMGMDDVHGC